MLQVRMCVWGGGVLGGEGYSCVNLKVGSLRLAGTLWLSKWAAP